MTDSCPDTTYFLGARGLYAPETPVQHRAEEYDPAGFARLRRMQEHHFWYQGRHRLLNRALSGVLRRHQTAATSLRAVDLGGGCGGWIKYVEERGWPFAELALADSSAQALLLAEEVVSPRVRRFQVDLLHLHWRDRWDVAFLLDVLEHIPEDLRALQQVHQALRPGGWLFLSVPALKGFWSHTDELAGHVRRYAKGDLAALARRSGLHLCYARYFMFFLSPLLLLSRWRRPDLERMTPEEVRALVDRANRVPAWPVNQFLRGVFSLETPLGLWLPFPWGTSLLGVFRKPFVRLYSK